MYTHAHWAVTSWICSILIEFYHLSTKSIYSTAKCPRPLLLYLYNAIFNYKWYNQLNILREKLNLWSIYITFLNIIGSMHRLHKFVQKPYDDGEQSCGGGGGGGLNDWTSQAEFCDTDRQFCGTPSIHAGIACQHEWASTCGVHASSSASCHESKRGRCRRYCHF